MNWFDELFKKTEKGEHKRLTHLIFILGVGILLFFISNNLFRPQAPKNSSDIQKSTVSTLEQQIIEEAFDVKLEKRLIQSLGKIEGVGKVDVMITVDTGKEIIINKDTPLTESATLEDDGEGGTRNSTDRNADEKTIMKNIGNGITEPIIIMEKEPIIKGIIIISEGGHDPYIKVQLMRAAEVLLGVPSHKVQVFKMK